jgi:hypothetical protein
MAADHIRYDILAQAALRGVVQTVLADAAKNGLPGEHHFKITFATGAPGVRLSDRMRAQYPQAMTIVLQHQFWDLAVRDEAFEVGLSFGGVPERLTVPFEAIMAFVDPAAEFGFQFSTDAETADDAASPSPQVAEPSGASPPTRPAETKPAPPAEQKKPSVLPAAAAEEKAPSSGEVVSLDRFRKK